VALRVCVVAIVVVVVPSISHAAPFTTHFDPLIAELQARLASGGLNSKETKATSKAFTIFDKPSGSLITDLKAAVKVSNKLKGAFPAEFDQSSGWGAFIDGTGELMFNALSDCRSDVSDARVPLDAAFDAIPWDRNGCPAHVKKFRDAAETFAISVHTTNNLAKQARFLIRALRQIPLGLKAAKKCAEKLGGTLPDT
jgi:hypothetical protein